MFLGPSAVPLWARTCFRFVILVWFYCAVHTLLYSILMNHTVVNINVNKVFRISYETTSSAMSDN